MAAKLRAGAAIADISPRKSVFLFGYPGVKRWSTAVHDPLLCSALYLTDGVTEAIFASCDLICVTKDLTARIRALVERETGVPGQNVMLAATHTHSGPVAAAWLSNEGDPVVPKPDPKYLAFVVETAARTCVEARANARPARAGLAIADATGVGTNRRDPKGPADPQAPLLLVKGLEDRKYIAAMVVYSMHPTVLHENSTLITADFPGYARRYLRQHLVGPDCPVIYHTGPCGNQSPRHVTRANTFAEAERLGFMLGRALVKAAEGITLREDLSICSARDFAELPARMLPTVETAQADLASRRARLETLRKSDAKPGEVRAAEVNVFGAEEALVLARADAEGRVEEVRRSCLPAEVQVISIGPWAFVGWPGEIFVEYALAVKASRPDTFVIELANGEVQGYIVTPEAAKAGGYEASNAMFAPESGAALVEKSRAVLKTCGL